MAEPRDVVVSQRDIEVFTESDCYVLARELHELTGWPMFILTPDAYRGAAEHVFVMTPTGHALDVEGIHTIEALQRRWGSGELQETTWDELVTGGWDGSLDEEAPQLARELAPHIIAEAERSPQMRAGAVALAALLPCS